MNATPLSFRFRARVSRRRLLSLLISFSAVGYASAESPAVHVNRQTGEVTLTNGRLELVVETQDGLNPSKLRDLKSGHVFADADYVWPGNRLPEMKSLPVASTSADGTCSVVFEAAAGGLSIVQRFSAPAGEPDVITEVIELGNPSAATLDSSAFACGFGKKICDGGAVRPDVADARFSNVPYRRHTETGELCDYSIADLLTKQNWFSTARSPTYNRRTTSSWGAEGWAWYQGNTTLLIAKYNPDAMEWALLHSHPRGNATILRFGGAGLWRLGDPEGAARLAPGATFRFGETRYQVLDGDWKAGYAAYRRFTESKGNRLPPNFDPPVHWNELYDNQLFMVKGDSQANRQTYYRKKDMAVEAAKAREFGCQCLYLDPGWDTDFGSSIWAEDRLGTQQSFVRWLKDEYHMALALHTPLAPWSNDDTYPPEARRMYQDGSRVYDPTNKDGIGDLCPASTAYIDTKIERLRKLCADGAYFLMFDGSWFEDTCWDPTHGHSLPLTRQEHVDAILKIAQGVHAAYPNVLIEQHDAILGPGTPRYVPTYFMYAKPGAFNELWGNEYMINPMDDIMTRRAMSLYYVDLAYSIPIYLHIWLKYDNSNALMFWWYASTCRHLGVGGKPTDPAVWEAQKKAMAVYMPLKRYFSQGIFYGLDETIHAHTLPDLNESVINCFNLEAEPVKRHVQFHLADVGLPSGRVEIEGASFTASGDEITMDVPIAGKAQQLVRIRVIGRTPL